MSQCFGVLMLGLILSVLFGHTVVVAHSSERAPEEKDLPKEKLSESITTTEEISAKEMNGHNVDNGFNAGKIDEKEPNAPDTSESEKPADYAKGSLCVYCKYCKVRVFSGTIVFDLINGHVQRSPCILSLA